MPKNWNSETTKQRPKFGHANRLAGSPCLHRFHRRHGLNIRISENQLVANRVSSFAEGLVFSAEPLQPNELFMVEIEHNDYGWNGHLRIGITQTDPAKRKDCPRFALPDLVAEGNSWVYTLDRTEVDDELGNTLILPPSKFRKLLRDAPWGQRLNFDMLEPRYFPSAQKKPFVFSRKNSYNDEFQARLVDNHPSPVPVTPTTDSATLDGSRVGVFYSKEGVDLAFLYFVVNGECRGPFPFELQEGPLFVICDVYGRTRTVKIVPVYEVPELKSLCRDAVVSAAQNLNELPLPPKVLRYLSYQSPSS